LFVLGDVEEALHYRRPGLGEELLEGVDVAVAGAPDGLRDELVDAGHEDVLVVGAIEDRELAACRRMRVHPPQEVVAERLPARLLEGRDLGPERVQAAEDVRDGPVLAGGVDPLQHDEE